MRQKFRGLVQSSDEPTQRRAISAALAMSASENGTTRRPDPLVDFVALAGV